MITSADDRTSAAPPSSSGSIAQAINDNDMVFVCNICLEGVKDKDPVVTQCGHLYCWPCLYRWLHTRHSDGTCPVCKAGVTQENVIPIFIKESSVDPRQNRNYQNSTEHGDSTIPSRPQGHRPEPINPLLAGMNSSNNNNNNTPQFGGISFAGGMGFFPSLFGLQFQAFSPPSAGNGDQEDQAYQAYLSRILFFLGASVVLCLLFF
jgi:E3 ubiquitin-protein ligase RNF5